MSPRSPKHSAFERVRCPRCLLQPRLCVCQAIEPLALATHVVVVRHRKEVHKPTNTGRLAALCLAVAELRTFGGRDEALDTRGFVDPARRTFVLYPAEDALPISADPHDTRPVTLIVPDADWRRTQKFVQHEPALAGLVRVRVPHGPPSDFRLRKHSDASFLSTFEAIARALGVLEGDSVRAELERFFRVFVDRALYQRGQLAAELVTGGVPPA